MPMVKVNVEVKRTTRQTVQACVCFIIFGVALIVLGAGAAIAQVNPPPPRSPLPPPRSDDPRDRDQTPIGSFEEEIRAKRAIKLAEKDHEENLARAKEISDLVKGLQASLKDKTTIDRDSLKKIERLEKLTKKIRNEAGGEDEEVKIVDRPIPVAKTVAWAR